jgi:hypothetical protein
LLERGARLDLVGTRSTRTAFWRELISVALVLARRLLSIGALLATAVSPVAAQRLDLAPFTPLASP